MSIHAYITEILATAPQHDLNMPHDTRYPGEIRGCPPNCPYRAGFEEAAALAAVVLAKVRQAESEKK